MKTIISKLFFDKELVSVIKNLKPTAHSLYNQLNAGKITLKEYLQLS